MHEISLYRSICGRDECEDAVAQEGIFEDSQQPPSLLPPYAPCSEERACTLPEDAETRKKLMMIFQDESIFLIKMQVRDEFGGQETSLLSSLRPRRQESW